MAKQITKSSIRKAIKEARGCSEGDLFLNDDNTVSFMIGYRNTISSEFKILATDFWYYVQKMTILEIIDMVQSGKQLEKAWI